MHAHNLFPLFSPAIFSAARALGVPVVQTLHNYRLGCAAGVLSRDGVVCEQCVGRLPLPAVMHRCYRGSAAGSVVVAGMIATHRTEFQRGKLIAMGAPADRLVVKPNFVADRPRSQPMPRVGAVFVGRLTASKGVDRLVEMWRGIDVPLTIAGTGPLEAQLRRTAPPHVRLLGHVDAERIRQEHDRAQLLIMPSLSYEGLALSVIEAWASGLPVLAFAHSMFVEHIMDGIDGLLAAPGDFAALGARLRWALANPNALEQIGRAGRRRYEERFTPEVNYRMLTDIYRDARAAFAKGVGDPARDR
jgi:glycosyltransferase involved in cell wall biosynthesis